MKKLFTEKLTARRRQNQHLNLRLSKYWIFINSAKYLLSTYCVPGTMVTRQTEIPTEILVGMMK